MPGNVKRSLLAVGLVLTIPMLALAASSSKAIDHSTADRTNANTEEETLLVPTQFPTIQAAVNAANTGDTIQILAGTYVEQVTISKDLRLLGSGANSTIIKAPATLTPGSFGRLVIVDIKNGAKVRMSRLTVVGPGSGSCGNGSLFGGIFVVEGATLNLSSAAVSHIHDTPIADCSPFGAAIRIGARTSSSTGHATIHDVVISDYQFIGILVRSPGSTATITENVITGVGPLVGVSPEGIDIDDGAVVTVTHNRISQNFCNVPGCGPDPINQTQPPGIAANIGTGAGTVIAHNDVSDNDVGIGLFFAPECCTVGHNRLTNNRFFGLLIQDGSNAASEDRISGGNVGVGVVADAVDTVGTLRDEKITETSVAPVQEISCCGFRATAIVQDPEDED